MHKILQKGKIVKSKSIYKKKTVYYAPTNYSFHKSLLIASNTQIHTKADKWYKSFMSV